MTGGFFGEMARRARAFLSTPAPTKWATLSPEGPYDKPLVVDRIDVWDDLSLCGGWEARAGAAIMLPAGHVWWISVARFRHHDCIKFNCSDPIIGPKTMVAVCYGAAPKHRVEILGYVVGGKSWGHSISLERP